MGTITEQILKARASGHPAVQLNQQQLKQLHREILAQAGPLARIQPAHLPPYDGAYLDLESGMVGVAEGRVTEGTLHGVHVLA